MRIIGSIDELERKFVVALCVDKTGLGPDTFIFVLQKFLLIL